MKRLLRTILVTTLMASLCGCGGGSKGTGGSGFDGRVLAKDSAPAPGVLVTLLETGAYDVTDDQGQFMFESEIPEGSANLRVESSGFAQDLTITDLSPSATLVTVTIQISVEDKQASIIDVSVEESPPTPTPKPHKPTKTPTPGGKPNKTPGATPAPGEPTPLPSLTPTAAPSAPPSATPTRTPESGDEEVEAEGRIQSLSSTSVTVRNITFILTPETVIRRGDKPASVAEMAVGDQVHAKGRRRSGVVYAEDIEIAE